jgi:hypothetical protein
MKMVIIEKRMFLKQENILEFKSEHNVITYLSKENLDISGSRANIVKTI